MAHFHFWLSKHTGRHLCSARWVASMGDSRVLFKGGVSADEGNLNMTRRTLRDPCFWTSNHITTQPIQTITAKQHFKSCVPSSRTNAQENSASSCWMALSICMCPTFCRTTECHAVSGGCWWWTKFTAYSIYLFSHDFHVFWSLKNALTGHMLLSDRNVHDVVQLCRQQLKELFAHGMYGLVHQWDCCLTT